MQNKNYLVIIEKIKTELNKNKFDLDTIVSDLKKLREISMDFQNPTITKALRLCYEHLELNKGFFITIPEDEPIESDIQQSKQVNSIDTDLESFNYFLSLLANFDKKSNVMDIKAYNVAFLDY